MLELASLAAPARVQERISSRQDQAAIAFSDKIAERLLTDHSLYAIRRMVPETLNTDQVRLEARQLKLRNLEKIL